MTLNLYNPDDLTALPSSLRVYGASDYATMEARAGKREPDFTEHGIWGVDRNGDLWAMDWWSGQTETDKSIAQFLRLVGLYKPIKWFHEGGLIDKAIGPAIRSEMRRSQKFTSLEALPSLQDKAIKLQSFHSRATAGTVHIPIRRKWAEDLIEQLVKFPAGRWDDKADVCGLIGRGVDLMFDASLPMVETKPTLIPFTGAWLEHGTNDDKPKVRFFS
jgi:predicted phage terminase large subunit-like protein